jgi:hypothetical protein
MQLLVRSGKVQVLLDPIGNRPPERSPSDSAAIGFGCDYRTGESDSLDISREDPPCPGQYHCDGPHRGTLDDVQGDCNWVLCMRWFSPADSVEFADSLMFRAYRSCFPFLQALGPGHIGNEAE